MVTKRCRMRSNASSITVPELRAADSWLTGRLGEQYLRVLPSLPSTWWLLGTHGGSDAVGYTFRYSCAGTHHHNNTTTATHTTTLAVGLVGHSRAGGSTHDTRQQITSCQPCRAVPWRDLSWPSLGTAQRGHASWLPRSLRSIRHLSQGLSEGLPACERTEGTVAGARDAMRGGFSTSSCCPARL